MQPTASSRTTTRHDSCADSGSFAHSADSECTNVILNRMACSRQGMFCSMSRALLQPLRFPRVLRRSDSLRSDSLNSPIVLLNQESLVFRCSLTSVCHPQKELLWEADSANGHLYERVSGVTNHRGYCLCICFQCGSSQLVDGSSLVRYKNQM